MMILLLQLMRMMMMMMMMMNTIVIKIYYNASSDWLKTCASLQNRTRVDDISWLLNFCSGILTNLTQIKHPLQLTRTQTQCKRIVCQQ